MPSVRTVCRELIYVFRLLTSWNTVAGIAAIAMSGAGIVEEGSISGTIAIVPTSVGVVEGKPTVRFLQ